MNSENKAAETTNTVEITQTDSEVITHPVKVFLQQCGIDVKTFPVLRFLIEVQEQIERYSRTFIPLRLPRFPGVFFESFFRVLRTVELPSTSNGKNQRFIEIEWLIVEEAISEEEYHSAFAFLSNEIICPSCRSIFQADIEIVTTNEVRVICPECLNPWKIQIEASQKESEKTLILLDEFRSTPSEMRRRLQAWSTENISAADTRYFSLFPFHFERWKDRTAVEWFFGHNEGFRALCNTRNYHFENLIKSFVNYLSVEYFKANPTYPSPHLLETTDIQRRSEIQRKREAQRKVVDELLPMNTAIKQEQKALAAYDRSTMRWVLPSITTLTLLVVFTASYFLWDYSHQQSARKLALKIEREQEMLRRPEVQKVEPAQEPVFPKDTIEKLEQHFDSDSKAFKPNEAGKIAKKVSNARKKMDSKKAKAIDENFRQAMLHLKLQHLSEAISEFKKILEIDPKNASSYRGLGLAYVYDHKFPEAIKAFEIYLSMAGDSFDRNSVEELLNTLKERTKSSVAQQ